jgi:uncharacterized OB-fold protein
MLKTTGVTCNNCGQTFYPKRTKCPNCKSTDLKEAEMGNVATLLTYTELWAVPKGIEQMPLMLGILEFENKARILGQLSTRDVKVGMQFQPVWAAIRKVNGKDVFGYRFEPIPTAP